CKNVVVTGSLSVSGSWTGNSNGTYTDDTTTTGTARIDLPAGWLMISGTTTTCAGISGPLSGGGFSSGDCTNAAGGGGTCNASIQHKGGIALLTADPQTNGNYTTSGNTLTADGAANYAYCVSGSTMTWTPQTTGLTTSGTIVFQKGSSTGTAGTLGTAGTTGT